MSKKGTQLLKLNWDEECELDFLLGRGFEITQNAIQGRDTKSENGIHSPKFGSDWSDDDAFAERYRCKCGEMVGKVYEGEVCPYCNTKIEFKDVDLKITGWIKLGEYKIIQPAYYVKLASIIGSAQFKEIVGFEKTVDKNGHLKGKEVPATPFKGIGLIEFRERFDEILEYYKHKKKNKLEEIEEIENDKDKVFASCIPVYSSVLRPLSFRGDALFYSTIDKKYNGIFSSAKLLKNSEELDKRRKKRSKHGGERMDIPTILSSIQTKLIELWELIFEQLDQKDGHIKSEILGGMLNYSSRCKYNAT